MRKPPAQGWSALGEDAVFDWPFIQSGNDFVFDKTFGAFTDLLQHRFKLPQLFGRDILKKPFDDYHRPTTFLLHQAHISLRTRHYVDGIDVGQMPPEADHIRAIDRNGARVTWRKLVTPS